MSAENHDADRPRGRGRPPSISSERLLEVAREVFLERGIRATTMEVAERAGVSEGTLFHRFGSKDGLFREAMSFNEEDGPERIAQAVAEVRDLDALTALTQLAEALIEIGRVAMPLLMMSWSNPGRCGPSAQTKQKFYEIIKVLAGDLQLRMDRGELRPLDTEVVARTFIGAIHHYSMARIASIEGGIPVVSESMFVRGLVDMLLLGIQPRLGSETARPRGER